MKRNICLLLAGVLCLTALAACGEQKTLAEETGHRLYVRDDSKSEKVTATFVNTQTRASTDTEMKLVSEGEEYNTFSCLGDTGAYNRVVISYDGSKTKELAFTGCVSGWYLSSYGVTPYAEGGETITEVTYNVKTFPYRTYQKDVYIWKHSDYDANAKEKYAVIYLEDGQKMLDANGDSAECWNVAQSVTGMMAASDHKAIVVAITTPELTRYDELTPDIGEILTDEYNYNNPDGKYFSDFVCGTVVPYIEKTYNVYTDPAHNGICGSSLGGLESFYIGMEHPEKFGTIGALSPTFGLYADETWKKYISSKDFSENRPFVYMYAGDWRADAHPCRLRLSRGQIRTHPAGGRRAPVALLARHLPRVSLRHVQRTHFLSRVQIIHAAKLLFTCRRHYSFPTKWFPSLKTLKGLSCVGTGMNCRFAA